MKREPKFTKAGNYLLRSTRSTELIKFSILVDAQRVYSDLNGWKVAKKNGKFAGNCNWAARELLNHKMAAVFGNLLMLTDLGREMLDAAWSLNTQITKLRVLREIDSKEVQ